MKKWKVIIGLGVIAGIALAASMLCCPGAPKHIVFVTIDTLRADHLSSYGYIRPSAPFVDGLAEDGVVFEKAFSACSHTAPSHSSFFTSLYPFQHQVTKNHEALSPNVFHVAKLAKAQGYEVMGFSSVNFMDDKVGFPRLAQDQDIPEAVIPPDVWFRNAKVQVDRVIHWMKNFRKEEKFFIWLHFYDVHQWAGHRLIPDSYWKAAEKTGDEKLLQFVLEKHKIPLAFHRTERRVLRAMNGYDARLRFVDDNLARLQDFFKEQGVDDDMLWIVSADHGEGLGNHNYEGHGQFIYNEQLHIPLIFHYSNGRYAGRRVPEMVRSIDFLPTLADIFGAPLPKISPALQGRSLLPFLKGGQVQGETPLGYAQRRPKDDTEKRGRWEDGDIKAMFSARQKYIHHSGAAPEFYDLEKDPFELENLAANSDAEVVENQGRLSTELNELTTKAEKLPEGSGEVEMKPEDLEELKSLGYL